MTYSKVHARSGCCEEGSADLGDDGDMQALAGRVREDQLAALFGR